MSEINTGGVLRTNRYHVTFAAPVYLRDDALTSALNDNSTSTPLDRISLRCESVQLPGVTMATIDGAPPRMGYGAAESMPYGTVFDDITLSFIVDAKSEVHRFFYKWVNTIVNFHSQGQSKLRESLGPVRGMKTYEVGYKKNFTTDLTITVYDGVNTRTVENGQNVYLVQGKRVMEVKVYNAFPKLLPSLDMSWGSNDEIVRLQIPFSYTDFEVQYPQEVAAPAATTPIA